MVIDFSRGGQPIGIEITAPRNLTLTAINRVLRELGRPRLKRSDLAPLLAAWPSGYLQQIAAIFASDGTEVIHDPVCFFDVPILGPLPEDLNFIP